MSGRLGNATDSAMARMIRPLSKPASPRPQAQNRTFSAQCMEAFLAEILAGGESDDGGVEGIESWGWSLGHYKNAGKAGARTKFAIVGV